MPEAPFDLTDRVVIITGGGTGIGRVTARVLARQGADIVLASRKVENLDAAAQEVTALGRRALPVQTDVRDQASVEAMARRVLDHFGKVDVLVNNAGGNRRSRLEEMPQWLWDNMVNLNLRGPFLCSQAVGKWWIQQGRGGAIVNISSGAAIKGTWGVAPYGSAKAGLNHLTRLMAGEWGPHNIRVNCLAVGAIKTEGFLGNMAKLGQDPDVVAGKNALRRGGWPEEVANCILFLACDASSFVTGETFSVSGGPYYDLEGA